MHWKQELTTDLAPNIWSIIGTASHVSFAGAMGSNPVEDSFHNCINW